jgi:putative nucleotidyltransferase with HDIG domain
MASLLTKSDKETEVAYFPGAYILTVDDFSIIRRVIINILRKSEADVDEAANGEIALSKLQLAVENNVPYDMVFLDIEMPVMDGITLIRKMREDGRFKDLPIVVMTSHNEMEEIKTCLELGVTDYIVKPASRERVLSAVTKALEGKDLSQRVASATEISASGAVAEKPEYKRIIFRKLETIENLPALPGVIERIRELALDPKSDNETIARIMADEPSMMANVLKLANSAMYGARERISSLQAAITRLGLQAVYNLATSIGVIKMLEDFNAKGFDHKAFCEHSISTGITMCVIADICKPHLKHTHSPDVLHLSGVLHDVGRLITLQFFEKEVQEAIALCEKHSLPLFLAEQRTIGVDHAAVGAWLAQKWNMDEVQRNVIAYHHDPLLGPAAHAEAIYICHAANYLCNQQKLGSAGDIVAPFFDQRVFDALGLTIDVIPQVINRVRHEAAHSEVLKLLTR